MLRVAPFRGDQVAAGVVVLTALVVLLQVRMGWGPGGQLAAASTAAAGVAVLVAGCPREPRPYVSAIVTSGLILLVCTLARLGEVLGVDGPVGGAGAVTWKLVVLGLTAAALARGYDAAAATLVAGLALAFVPLAFFGWVTDLSGGVERLLLLVMAVGLALAAVTRRDRRPTHAAQLANAGGVALAAIAAGPVLARALGVLVAAGGATAGAAFEALLLRFGDVDVTRFDSSDGSASVSSAFFDGRMGWGWEVPLVVGGFGLLAYGAVDRQRGPVLVGLLVLTAWVASASGFGQESLLGWPLVLALAAALMLVVGLRPTTPAPPDPLDGERDAPPPAPLPLR